MKKQLLTLAVIATTSLGFTSHAAAQGPDGAPPRHRQGGPGGPGVGPGGPGGPPFEMIAEHLGLSDEQKAQARAIFEKQMAATKPLMKAAGDAAAAFEKALETDTPDAAAIGQAAIAMRNARRDVQTAHQAGFAEIKAILTPEQLAKVEAMEKQRGDHRPGFGPGGPGGQRHWRGPGHSGK